MSPRYVQCECRIVSVATTTTTEPTTTTTEPTTTTTGMYDCYHVAFLFHSNFTKTPLEFNPVIKKRAAGLGGSDGCLLTFDQEVTVSTAASNILSWRFDHEIFSAVMLSLPLIQEGPKECAKYWLTT